MMEIHLIFTTSNQLKISFANNVNQHLGFKICFSLVYSIINVDGGTITKKVGRYYEILSEKSEIFLTLQKTKIGSYNLSCGPEGLFVIDDNDKKLECFIRPLTFQSPIPRVNYTEYQEIFLYNLCCTRLVTFTTIVLFVFEETTVPVNILLGIIFSIYF